MIFRTRDGKYTVEIGEVSRLPRSRGQGPVRGDVFPWWLLTFEAMLFVVACAAAAKWIGGAP